MTKKVTTLAPETSLLEASKLLVKKRWLCAPVVDRDGKFLGVFSQQCAMRALVRAVYEEIPSTEIGAWLDPNPLTIPESATMVRCAQTFANPKHRGPALIVLQGDKVVGIVSRLDVLASVAHYLGGVPDRETRLLYLSALRDADDAPHF
jgi:predicted transcriptional regulator